MKIVMYHYVRKPDTAFPHLHFLHVDDFRRQLDFFQQDGRILTRNELEAALTAGDPLGEKDYLLTFDDGLRDHYEYVLPELRERGVTGIFLHCTGAMGRRRVLDVHAVHALLAVHGGQAMLRHCRALLDAEGIGADAGGFSSPVYTMQQAGADTEFKRIMNYCLGAETRSRILEALVARHLDGFNIGRDFYIGAEELRQMEEAGMIIGGHTANHPLLSSLDGNAQRREIAANLKTLEEMLGHSVRWFCFPYGGAVSYNAATLSILKECGVRYCLSVEARDVSAKDLEAPLELPRYDCMSFPHGKSYITKQG